MKKLLLSLVFVLTSVFTIAQTKWEVDLMHSSINFNIKHLGISFVQGRFDKFEGNVVTGKTDLDKAEFNFEVFIESINTGVDARDKHLISADFFDAAKFQTMKFSGKSVKEKDNSYTLVGKLTIKGVTKEVSIPLTYGGIAKNQQGKEVLGFQAKFKINRLDYNIKYDPTGTGVGKDVEVNVYFEMLKQ